MKKFVGFFDSGIGGLSVLHRVVMEYPQIRYIYLGDNENAPYGTKSKLELLKLSYEAVAKLISKGCNIIVIACNTVSLTCGKFLKRCFPKVKFVLMNPLFALTSEKGLKSLILCTEASKDVLRCRDKNISVCSVTDLAGYVEKNVYDIDKTVIFKLLDGIKKDFDVVVLGCTHYAYVKNYVQEYFYQSKVLDGVEYVLYQLEKIFKNSIYNEVEKHSKQGLLTTDIKKQGELTTGEKEHGISTTRCLKDKKISQVKIKKFLKIKKQNSRFSLKNLKILDNNKSFKVFALNKPIKPIKTKIYFIGKSNSYNNNVYTVVFGHQKLKMVKKNKKN